MQLQKGGAVARVESVVLDWSCGHPQAIDTCIRAQAPDRTEALDNSMRLWSQISRCIQEVCERYAPGIALAEPEAISIRALWRTDSGGGPPVGKSECIPIHELERMKSEGELHWGLNSELIDELLGRSPSAKRKLVAGAGAGAGAGAERQRKQELDRIANQPALREYYSFMRMKLRNYFAAVSAIRSGTYR